MKKYTIKLVATAKPSNPRFAGRTITLFIRKNGCALDDMPRYPIECFDSIADAQKEVDKVEDELHWLKKAEVVEMEF